MKRITLLSHALLSAVLVTSVTSFGMGGLDFVSKINLNETLKKAKDFADQASLTMNTLTDLERVKSAAITTLQSLPNELLGVNIEQLKRGQVDPAVLAQLQQSISIASESLPIVALLLQFPSVVVDIINSLILPSLEPRLSTTNFGKQVLGALRASLDFAVQNEGTVAAVSKPVAQLLNDLGAGLNELKNKNLAQLDAATLASAFARLKNRFEANYQVAAPAVRTFIEANIGKLQQLLMLIASINVTADIEQILKEAHEDAKKLGSTFGGGF